MEFNITSTKRVRSGQRGFSLIEVLVALAVSGIVLSQICLLWYYGSRSFVAQLSYVDLDQKSQRALDIITREIRQCKSLIAFRTNQVVLRDFDDQVLIFTFVDNKLTRTKAGVIHQLLKDVESGGFSIFQRNPVAGAYDQYPTADPATCKLIEVHWACARKLLPSAPMTKESMQSAKVVLRTNNSP